MNTQVAIRKENTLPAFAMSEEELMSVLRNSLYVGAQDESIKMVMGYCKAMGFDPMQKPVHIVPMYASTGKKDAKGYDIKQMRDVIMPGIGTYRIQAARTGEYAGVSEPEFGPDVNEELEGVSVTYPKWCKVTVVRRLASGFLAEFTSCEYWKENYATKSRESLAPNQMWYKRGYGQLAKCAEAQALRKGFPEIGAAPTADEMEGKTLETLETSDELPNTRIRRANGAEVAEAARLTTVEGNEEARKFLIESLTSARLESQEAFRNTWFGLSEQEKTLVGIEERNRIDKSNEVTE